jgi:DNA helicase IV
VTAHPDLVEEQAHLDRAYECLAAMRERTARMASAEDLSAGAVDGAVAAWHLRRRLATMDDTGTVLCFGRLDTDDGETFHVGRRHVEDGSGEPVVVDWRAPVSTPFYRATVRDAMGLERRRRFMVEQRRLVDIFDERFDDPDSVTGGGVPDPLLAELERARTGEMRDIVATIQAEQDVVIRAPLDTLLVVQGGPGTGKTAVGLHRAAFLLYEHRQVLEEQRVLVVGPNRVFLRYISAVLPSLGETAVVQATVETLAGARWRVRAGDDPAVATLKGDPRMAGVLATAVRQQLSPPGGDVDVVLTSGRARLAADDVAEVMATTFERTGTFAAGRDVFRSRMHRLAWDTHRRQAAVPAPEDRFLDELRADRAFAAAVGRMWPAVSAAALVRRTIGNRRALARAADGILSRHEQALLRRAPARRVDDEPWTPADLPLLDEAEALLNGVPATYGHVVVDEAQDLSAMALRMVARRSPTGSLTVLGDLAQATAPWGQDHWEDAVAHLRGAGRAEVRIEELGLGYRVPEPILEVANRLLPEAAPHVRPARSVRTAGPAPAVVAAASPTDLPAAVAGAVKAAAGRWSTVGVIAVPADLEGVERALQAAGVAAGSGLRVGLGERVTLLPPAAAKGLEFDAVVVVEPAAVVAGEPRGARALYVAMTRAVQHLTLVHARPLPRALRGAAAA